MLSADDGGDFLWRCAGQYTGSRSVKAFLRYALAQYRHEREDEAYRIYVTDALRLVAENTAASVCGKYLTARFADVIAPPKEEDKKTCEEITAEIIARCGLVVKE